MTALQSNLEWFIHKTDEDAVERLTRKSNLSDPIARILVNRKIVDDREANKFLNPSFDNLPDEKSLPDIDVATDRILRAVRDKESIVVYGDYDADGITGTALLTKFLGSLGAQVTPYQPHRVSEGYGLNLGAIDKFHSNGVKLVIAVDLGIADAPSVDFANSKSIDTIIVDHHQIPSQLPNAVAIIDPLISKDAAEFQVLSGVGLAFFLAKSVWAAAQKDKTGGGQKDRELKKYLDLVALGTVADMMPLTGINRILVKHGLDELGAERRPGIAALKARAKLDRKRITAGQVAFQLGPRLNAAGRMGDASIAVELLATEDITRARILAKRLDEFNQERQNVEKQIVEEVIRIIHADGFNKDAAMVLAGDKWHPGVLGIVASRIVERYSVPVAVISFDGIDGKGVEGKGSVRSVQGVNAWKVLEECSDTLLGYGGHEMAGGLNIRADKVDEFRMRFREAVAKYEIKAGPKKLNVDMELDLGDLDKELVDNLALLAPHGIGNPEPLFFSSEVRCESIRSVGTNHLKFKVISGKNSMDAIAFSQADRRDILSKPIDVVFTPIISSWGGFDRIEIKVKDIRPA